ncbi:MAG: exo-alpha-sialidase, partial [Planctomycetaceae bacterium]|nr:exo-alpha-sialidase [Planctomycetaceae bacterium]
DSNWTAFRPAPPILDPPVVQSSLQRISSITTGHRQNLIVFCGPDENGPSGKGRSDLRLRYSTDEAVSWHDGPLLHAGPAAYSDLVVTSDGNLGVLFECGDASGKNAYQRIDFMTLPVSQVTHPE